MKDHRIRFVVMTLLILFVFITQAPSAFAHGVICRAFTEKSTELTAAPRLLPAPRIFSDSFRIQEIDIKAALLPTSDKDPNFQKSRLMLLSLLADPIFESGSVKDTLTRGELRLGANIGDGRSLEFEYRGDQRGDEMVLRLNRITLYKPNGQSISIDRNPLSDDGRSLIAKPISLIDRVTKNSDGSASVRDMKVLDAEGLAAIAKNHEFLVEAMAANKASSPLGTIEAIKDQLGASDREALAEFSAIRQTIEIPVTIEGALMTELALWLKRLPDVSRTELRQAAAGQSLRSLIWKVHYRQKKDYFLDKIVMKQAFKLPFILILFWGIHEVTKIEMPNISQWLPNQAAVERVVEGKATITDRPEYKTVREILDGLNLPAGEKEALDGKAREDINTAVNGRDVIGALSQLQTQLTKDDAEEIRLGGASSYYQGSTLSLGLLPNWKGGFMVAHYPLQKKVLLIPIAKVNGVVPSAAVIIIKEKSFPETYKAISEKYPKS